MAAVTFAVQPASVKADEINLTTAGSFVLNGDGQGSHFFTTEQQPTGTGVIDPFLTIQRKWAEHGYNTDAGDPEWQFDQKRGAGPGDNKGWTRSLLLSDIAPVSLTGQQGTYIKFLLDINEDNGNGALLSLNKIQLFVTNDQFLTGYTYSDFTVGKPTDGFGTKATMVYDLDGKKDNTIELNYDLGHGSGSGDMYAYIPYAVIAGRTEKYLTMYSSFGDPNKSSAGFEEWSVAKGAPVPLPAAAWAGFALLGGVGLKRRFGRRQAVATA